MSDNIIEELKRRIERLEAESNRPSWTKMWTYDPGTSALEKEIAELHIEKFALQERLDIALDALKQLADDSEKVQCLNAKRGDFRSMCFEKVLGACDSCFARQKRDEFFHEYNNAKKELGALYLENKNNERDAGELHHLCEKLWHDCIDAENIANDAMKVGLQEVEQLREMLSRA